MRPEFQADASWPHTVFPFLLGGTFIEAFFENQTFTDWRNFPFLLGGTFIEASERWEV